MSYAALARAALPILRTALGLSTESVMDGVTQEPDALAGEVFVRVLSGGSFNRSPDIAWIDERQTLLLCVTFRSGWTPPDRIGKHLITSPGTGQDAFCRAAAVALHGNYTLINNANTELGGSVNGFCHPLRWSSTRGPTPRGPEWFGGESPDWDAKLAPSGVSYLLAFEEAQRVQSLESWA